VTLLELLVAVSILGVMAALLYGTFSRTLATRNRASAATERYATARAAMQWLAEDLEGSFGCGLYPSGAKRFLGGHTSAEPTLGGAPLLDVTITSARSTTPLTGPLPAIDDVEDHGDQARVLYHLEEPPERDFSKTGLDLVRYEHRPPLHVELEKASRAVVARGLGSIELRYFDGASWHEEWDSAASGARHGTAPKVVEARIRLVAEGDPIEVVSAFYVTLGGRRG
jgi:prepilin-type N-terminal cleavage/methylation domain-containing protein